MTASESRETTWALNLCTWNFHVPCGRRAWIDKWSFMKVDENIRAPLVVKQPQHKWECRRQSFDFESRVCCDDNASHGVICVSCKWAPVTNGGTVWARYMNVGGWCGFRAESYLWKPSVLPVLQDWGQDTPSISFTCDSNPSLTFRTRFSASIEHNGVLCANAFPQIQPTL